MDDTSKSKCSEHKDGLPNPIPASGTEDKVSSKEAEVLVSSMAALSLSKQEDTIVDSLLSTSKSMTFEDFYETSDCARFKSESETTEIVIVDPSPGEDEMVYTYKPFDFDEDAQNYFSEVAEEDIYANWDPMKEHYYSAANFSSLDTVRPGYAILGDMAPSANMRTQDVPCPFNDPKIGRCYKDNCMHYHHMEGSNDWDPLNQERIRRVAVSYVSQLEEKFCVANGTLMEVDVEHIISPTEFFVTCEADFKCCCDFAKCEIPSDKTLKSILESKLTKELKGSKFAKTKFNEYIEHQLVAVKQIVNGKTKFFRGVILETTTDIEDYENPKIPIQLLDTGEKLSIKFTELCHLPSPYVVAVPALAYRCSLYGIVSIGQTWSPEAVEYFKTLVKDKKCLLMIKKTTHSADYSPIRLFENNPYQVELRIPRRNNITGKILYRSVADLLGNIGLGVQHSLSVFRPICFPHPWDEFKDSNSEPKELFYLVASDKQNKPPKNNQTTKKSNELLSSLETAVTLNEPFSPVETVETLSSNVSTRSAPFCSIVIVEPLEEPFYSVDTDETLEEPFCSVETSEKSNEPISVVSTSRQPENSSGGYSVFNECVKDNDNDLDDIVLTSESATFFGGFKENPDLWSQIEKGNEHKWNIVISKYTAEH